MEKKNNQLISAIITIAIGLLFIVCKNDIIGITMTVFGVALIVSAVFDFVHKQIVPGVVKSVVGVVVIIFGWTLMSAALYIMAALLLIYGLLLLYAAIQNRGLISDKVDKVLSFVQPSVYIFVGICLLFNQGGTIDWVFILSGIFLVIEGIVALVQYLKKK